MFEELDQERQALDQKYQQIDESFGFSQPELTDEQWQEYNLQQEEIMSLFNELNQNYEQLDEQYKITNESNEGQINQHEQRQELLGQQSELNDKIQEINEQFGFVESNLTDEQWNDFNSQHDVIS